MPFLIQLIDNIGIHDSIFSNHFYANGFVPAVEFVPEKNVHSTWTCLCCLNLHAHTHIYIYTLQGINISHLGKRKIIFKSDF